MKRSIRWF